ncbi:MAG: hypothetical protein DI535_25135 [Citrobacter freundii]|nr:MAG: hypothetical protein DI535_25135 [Citrobacter freundii]
MKRKSIYLLLLICSLSLISSARQQGCADSSTVKTTATQAKNSEADTEETRAGYDLSPVGFFVLNM